MRRNADKAADYASRHNVPVWYSDANELINDPNINAIYIATPPKFHEFYAIAAMEKGKAVYVEKPVTLHVNSCKRMIDAVRMNDGKLTVAHYRRALPMFLKVKEMVLQQMLGRINKIELKMFQPHESGVIANVEENWRVVPSLSGGGYFYDLAPHQLDILVYIFGDPLEYRGLSINQSMNYGAEDAVSGELILKMMFFLRAVGILIYLNLTKRIVAK
jgi:predicted dehydrogenase